MSPEPSLRRLMDIPPSSAFELWRKWWGRDSASPDLPGPLFVVFQDAAIEFHLPGHAGMTD
jgi:hypothetical protein